MRLANLAWCAIPLLLTIAACQSGAPTTPTAESQPPAASSQATLDPAQALFGAWTLAIDPVAETVDLTPVRQSMAFGDNYWINATGYLSGSPCGDCISVNGFARDVDGNLDVRLGVRHPFTPGVIGQPITGANRLDLHVFDARLLIAGTLNDATGTFPSGSATMPSGLLVNADGFSGLLTPVVQTMRPDLSANAYPYVILGEDPTVGNFAASNAGGFSDLQVPTGHNVFPMGADLEESLLLGLSGSVGQVQLTLFFAANYGISATSKSERLTPRYAMPEYNSKPAWKVEIDIPEATNNLSATNPASTADVSVRVWDWQQGATVDASLASLDTVRATSEVASVFLSVPDLMASAIHLGAPVSGTGPLDDPLVYNGLILNSLSAAAGQHVALVEVTDSRALGLNGGIPTEALSNQDGLSLENVAVNSYKTYQVAIVSVETGVRVPDSIDILPNTRQLIAQGAAEAVTFTATGNYSTPPFTEDLTATADWNTVWPDVGDFAGINVFTGIGMGIEQVTASFGGTESAPTEVIVKPEEFQSIVASYASEIDANHTTGEIFITENFPNKVEVYDDDGVFVRSWLVPDSVMDTSGGSRLWGVTVDQTNGEVYLASGWYKPSNNNVAVYDNLGNLQRTLTIEAFLLGPNDNQTITGLSMLDNGRLWHADFLGNGYVSYGCLRHDPQTGATIDGMNDSYSMQGDPRFWASIGADTKDNLLYIAHPGGRGIADSTALQIVDLTAKQFLAWGGHQPPNTGQDDQVAVDRDGLIHLTWSGYADTGPADPQIEVYEFTPPNSLAVLYTYRPSQQATALYFCRGIGIARTKNTVVLSHNYTGATGRLSWFE